MKLNSRSNKSRCRLFLSLLLVASVSTIFSLILTSDSESVKLWDFSYVSAAHLSLNSRLRPQDHAHRHSDVGPRTGIFGKVRPNFILLLLSITIVRPARL